MILVISYLFLYPIPMDQLRIATRNSPLALWQANFIAQQLQTLHPHLNIELVPMVTSGDKFLKDQLKVEGGKGLFVKELEEALLAHKADIAVHSMKDVPATYPDGLYLPTICQRENPLDAWISNQSIPLINIPKGAIIGTSSLRRQSQLLALRPDLQVKNLRGNVNSRINKLRSGDYDAIILASAGLKRLDMEDEIVEILSQDIMLPSCGQGALGIECRINDKTVEHILSPLNDLQTALCVKTERHVNQLLGGNCHVPLAVYCQLEQNVLVLKARVLKADGSLVMESEQKGKETEAINLAERCVQDLINQGAQKLLDGY